MHNKQTHYKRLALVAWRSGTAFQPINKVTLL